MASIPASELVQVNPSVIGTGGNPLSLSCVVLTNDTSIPIGSVRSFQTALSVASWFGQDSDEYAAAQKYFLGHDTKTLTPSELFFVQYPVTDTAAQLQGGNLSLSLTALQTYSGTLSIVVNGSSQTSSAINLAGATSFSNAAELITAAMTGVSVTYDSVRDRFLITSATTGQSSTISYCSAGTFAGQIKLTEETGATLNQGATAAMTEATSASLTSGKITALLATLKTYSGTLIVVVDGITRTSSTIDLSGATDFSNVATLISAGFADHSVVATWNTTTSKYKLTSATTGSNSTITYATGTLATNLLFTVATGAYNVQGADSELNPNATMNNITLVTQNWATFFTMWEPDYNGKIAFANWSNAQNKRYLYIAWDSDLSAIASNATTTFGYYVQDAEFNGVTVVYPTIDRAAFLAGAIASINFSATNGRTTLAYRSQSGMVADIVDPDVAQNLIDNGYNFYGAYATANQRFQFFQPGQLSGDFSWIDSYVNQIYFSSQLQLAVLSFLSAANSVPYNQDGYAAIKAALQDPVKEFKNFGGIRVGVSLSDQQKAIITSQAGLDISASLYSQGYYIQVLDATAQNRGLRKSPPINVWYMDGGSIQQVNIASYEVQ